VGAIVLGCGISSSVHLGFTRRLPIEAISVRDAPASSIQVKAWPAGVSPHRIESDAADALRLAELIDRVAGLVW
jgi:hypothetical protein